MRIGEILDVGSFYNLYAVHLICGNGSIYHIVVYKEAFGKLDFRHFSEGSGIGKHAGQSRYCGRLGADKVYLCIGCTAASFKVAVEGAERNTCRIGRLTHSDAGTAGTFENSCARCNNVGKSAVLRHHIKHLTGTGGNGQADGGAYRLSFEYFCHLHHIQKRGICAGADTYLVDLDGADLVNGFYGVGGVGAGCRRAK